MFGSTSIRHLSPSEEFYAKSESFISLTVTLRGPVDVGAMAEAFETLLRVHPAHAGYLERGADGRHQIIVETDGHGDLRGSESELVSALGNLVSNAVRYTPAGGTIRIQWHASPRGAEFAVEDSGIGIAPEHLPRLTERFYRVDRGRSRDSGGTGLGLAIVKHSLNRHQAQLEIKSVLGQGSRFIARFPGNRVAGV